jgi:hypothetical protein
MLRMMCRMYIIAGMSNMTLPKDPVMLLSLINTKLRDFNSSLEDFCKENDLNEDEIKEKLEMIDYHYDELKNKFV